MRLTIIDRYLFREILLTCGAVVSVLLLIQFSNSLIYMLGKVVEGSITGDVVMPLFLTNVASVLVMLVPPSLYLGVLLTLGRLYADSEMSALRATGYGPARLYRPILLAAVVVSVLGISLSVYVAPWAERVDHDIRVQLAERSDLAGITPGQFTRTGGGDVILFAENRGDDGGLENVFVEAERDGETVIIHAREAGEQRDEETGWRYIEFRDGSRHEGSPGGAEFASIDFARHGLRLPQRDIDTDGPGREGQTLAQLRERGQPADHSEIQWRLSVPIVCLTLALAALPLAKTTPRKGRYSRIAPALLLYLLYANLMVLARDAIADGTVPPAIGMWWAHALVLALVGSALLWQNGWRWTVEVAASLLKPGRS